MAWNLLEAKTAPSMRPLDTALEYIRGKWYETLPLYIVGAAPMSAAVYLLLDILSVQRFSALGEVCFFLALATLWKWVFACFVQRRVHEDITGKPGPGLSKRISGMLYIKLAASMAMMWGGLLVLPGLYGLIATGLAAPALLDRKDSPLEVLEWVIDWVGKSMWQAAKIASALSVGYLMTYFSLLVLQGFFGQMVLPSFFGFDPAESWLTFTSFTWQMTMAYVVFLVMDYFWLVASVMLHFDIQSKKTGADLWHRLRELER
ncbi:MAG: hypothetical protein OEZ04_09615 [Nitrospinota bacterium]|nr:hypothetical protein [Nitrospinota bacterium]